MRSATTCEVDARCAVDAHVLVEPPCARAAEREEAADRGEQFRLVEQEGVMAAVGLDLDEGDRGAGGVQRMHDRAALLGREQPVAGEGDHAEARLGAGEGLGQPAAMVGGEVEIVHRPGHVEIGIGVEAVDEGHALVAQIALDLEIGVEAEGQRLAVLQIAAELAVQRRLRQIGDVGGHARHREALFRALAVPRNSCRRASRDRP